MNKKGFTLIELMISIGLISIMLIFMMNTLVKLRDTSIASGVETNLQVGQAIITHTVNSDVLENNGILSVEDEVGNSICNGSLSTNPMYLTLKNSQIRILKLEKDNTVFTYIKSGEEKPLVVRKTPNDYSYSGFKCETIGNLIKITIYIKDNPIYASEVLYYNE